ncbi:hypothetical protein MMPV_007119 [Pyropia vietnamensis]
MGDRDGRRPSATAPAADLTAALKARLDAFLPALRAANEALPPPQPPSRVGQPRAAGSQPPRLDDLVGPQPVPVVVVGDSAPSCTEQYDAHPAGGTSAGAEFRSLQDSANGANVSTAAGTGGTRPNEAGWVEMDLLYDATEHGELVASASDENGTQRGGPLIEELQPSPATMADGASNVFMRSSRRSGVDPAADK